MLISTELTKRFWQSFGMLRANKSLTEAQRAWIASRDAEAERAAKEAEGGSMAPTLRYEKMAELTQERTKDLKVMLDHGTASLAKPAASSVPAAPASGMGQSPPEASPS